MTVLILGGMDDAHACHMLEHLRFGGTDAELFDSRWFPSALQIAYAPSPERGSLRLPTGRVLTFEEITSVYWRCYNNVQPPELPDAEQAFIAGNDARGLFESVLIRLGARWVNTWRAYQLHQTKPVQGGAHTRRLTSAHLDVENLGNLALAPVTIQEEVPGTNVRVFVAGQRVLACEVRTEALDFRDDGDPVIVPHDLPTEVAEWCLRVARALDLVWTGIDLRLNPEGKYLFLEANPSPMFLGFESRSGLPLTASLAALLV